MQSPPSTHTKFNTVYVVLFIEYSEFMSFYGKKIRGGIVQITQKTDNKRSRVDKRMVICLNCGHEFISRVKDPRCGKCNSLKVLDVKKAGIKEIRLMKNEIERLKEELEQSRKQHSKDLRALGNDMKSLYRYIDQIVKILKDNGLTPNNK